MSLIALLVSLFSLNFGALVGPQVDVERSTHRHVIQDVQPINPCAGSGCR